MKEERKIYLEITSDAPWWNLQLKEIWAYKDLIGLFVRRDFVSLYKQTVLGPLWYIIQPILTTFMFMVVFNRIAGLSTDGVPPVLFYLSGLIVWNYFSQCLISTSNTFLKNANIFGKVYFPRMVMPVATVISNLISFGIQFVLLLILMVYYLLNGWHSINFMNLLWIPFIILLLALLGLGLGLMISALTTKYRDFSFLVSFGIQLMMYGTPVIYSVSSVSEKFKFILLVNPLSSLVEGFRFAILGTGYVNYLAVIYSIVFTFCVLLLGILIFNKTERNFVDVI